MLNIKEYIENCENSHNEFLNCIVNLYNSKNEDFFIERIENNNIFVVLRNNNNIKKSFQYRNIDNLLNFLRIDKNSVNNYLEKRFISIVNF